MGSQMSIFEDGDEKKNIEDWLATYKDQASLNNIDCEFEYWEIQKTNSEISYLSHDFFRYFGKFPPPVAERFIDELHEGDGGPIVDPTAGSGTTLVEALLSGDDAIGMDINPLSCLVCKVKTTHIDREDILNTLGKYRDFFKSNRNANVTKYVPDDRYMDHWFYEDVQKDMARSRMFIENEIKDKDIKDLFDVGLASIVRNVSMASNGLGRMFKDSSIPKKNVKLKLESKIKKMSKVCDRISEYDSNIEVKTHDAKKRFSLDHETDLVICHPPYFNLYRYSSIYKFETLWAGMEYNGSLNGEIREGFKKGDRTLLPDYLSDMKDIIENSMDILAEGGYIVLMIGDTIIKDERVNTTSRFIDYIDSDSSVELDIEKIIVRKPKYTEASYSATQRRSKEDVGISLADHIIIAKN